MIVQGRDQDASLFYLHFDGSILSGTRSMAEHGILFSEDAIPYVCGMPYNLQIDTSEELELVRRYMSYE